MATFISHSPAETAASGEQFGRVARNGQVIALSGDLGAGKTQWVKGLARGLGITANVHSPTFALVNSYAGGRLPLFHLDLFRLETRAQIIAAGLEEFLNPPGVAVIEWAERLLDPSPPSGEIAPLPGSGQSSLLTWVRFEVLSETERQITYETPGA